ncbi:hypothetical protein [Serratia liquefaciens]|uniref:hypothetical protein n=1 Tax=Serratia liquefaciens TaxID=614 RepID=UPI00061B772A|nr:hypothetical protein [Serratia liquefaciens]AKE12899.1 hypothetical protein XJ20_24620 [Serratia liquefaciens]
MRKGYSTTDILPCRYIDVWGINRLSEQSSVLALAIGKLAKDGQMEDCEMEILLQIQEGLSDQISNRLRKFMREGEDD